MLSEAHGVDLNGRKAGQAGVPSLQHNPLCAADSISTSSCLRSTLLTRLGAMAQYTCQQKLKLLLPHGVVLPHMSLGQSCAESERTLFSLAV